MVFEVSISKKAKSDLHEIANYIKAGLIPQAEDWFIDLYRALMSFEHMPERETSLAGKPQFRQILYGSKPHVYRIIYRVAKRKRVIVIARVRHGARHGSGV